MTRVRLRLRIVIKKLAAEGWQVLATGSGGSQ